MNNSVDEAIGGYIAQENATAARSEMRMGERRKGKEFVSPGNGYYTTHPDDLFYHNNRKSQRRSLLSKPEIEMLLKAPEITDIGCESNIVVRSIEAELKHIVANGGPGGFRLVDGPKHTKAELVEMITRAGNRADTTYRPTGIDFASKRCVAAIIETLISAGAVSVRDDPSS